MKQYRLVEVTTGKGIHFELEETYSFLFFKGWQPCPAVIDALYKPDFHYMYQVLESKRLQSREESPPTRKVLDV